MTQRVNNSINVLLFRFNLYTVKVLLLTAHAVQADASTPDTDDAAAADDDGDDFVAC